MPVPLRCQAESVLLAIRPPYCVITFPYNYPEAGFAPCKLLVRTIQRLPLLRASDFYWSQVRLNRFQMHLNEFQMHLTLPCNVKKYGMRKCASHTHMTPLKGRCTKGLRHVRDIRSPSRPPHVLSKRIRFDALQPIVPSICQAGVPCISVSLLVSFVV